MGGYIEYHQVSSVPPVWRRKRARRVGVVEPVNGSASEANTSIERMCRDAILVSAMLSVAVSECKARTVALLRSSCGIRVILFGPDRRRACGGKGLAVHDRHDVRVSTRCVVSNFREYRPFCDARARRFDSCFGALGTKLALAQHRFTGELQISGSER